MISILILVTGEEIIGDMIHMEEVIHLKNPMRIIEDETGMRLYDMLLFSHKEQNLLIFRADDVITLYRPSDPLVQYYHRAHDYSNKYVKAKSNASMELAIAELDGLLQDMSPTKKSKLLH